MYVKHIVATLVALTILGLTGTGLLASSQPYISGHNINFGVGNKYYTETDVNLTGPAGSLTFKRTYNSQSAESGSLGYGWTSSFGERLVIETGRIILVQAGGRHVHFLDDGTGTRWVNEFGKVRTITKPSTSYILTEPDGTLLTFEETDPANARLVEKKTPDNYTLTLTYPTDSMVVTDSFDRTLTFTYVSGRLTQLTTPAGVYQYDYNGDRLISVTNLKDPGNATDDTTREYKYEDPNDPNNLTSVIDEAGITLFTVGYDTYDRVATSSLAGGADPIQIDYLANLQRTITRTGDPATTTDDIVTNYQLVSQNGVIRVQSYDGPGCSSCGSGTDTAYAYDDPRYNITQKMDANGNITTYSYEYDPETGSKTKKTQTEALADPDGDGVPETTAETRTTITDYDPATSRVTQITKASVVDPTQDAITSITYVSDANGETITTTENGFARDANGDPVSISRTTTRAEDTFGRTLSIDGPRTDVTDVTTFTYYPDTTNQGLNRANLKTVTNALGQTTTYGNYNAFGKAELITPPYGPAIALNYDDYTGRLLSKTQGSIVTSYDYYDNGRLHQISQPENRTITYTYTDSGKPQTITDGMGNSITYIYEPYETSGKPERMEIHDPTSQLQHFIEYAYEDTGNLDQTTQADGTSELLDYDPVGNLTLKTDPLGIKTKYEYDALNRIETMIEDFHNPLPDPLAGTENATTVYQYDSNDNLLTVTIEKDAQTTYTTTYTYDDFGRKASRVSPDTGLTLYDAYDLAGNLLSKTDSRGITTTYQYDALGRLTDIMYPDATQNISYTYDENGFTGLLTTMSDPTGTTTYQYDAYGRLEQETRNQGGQFITLIYGYNDNNELTSITYPSGRVVTYARNDAGQVTDITSTFQGAATTIASNITHKPFGPQEDMDLGNGISIDNTLNQLYRLTKSTAGTVFNRDYAYWQTGHVQTITDNIDPAASQSFTYDDLGRLDTAQGTYGTYDWDYDKIGNRLAQTLGADVTGYTYEPGTNRLDYTTQAQTTTDYTFDDAGNMATKDSTSFNWDQNNRLATAYVDAVQVGLYGYDGRNLRTKRTVNGVTVYSVYDQAGNLLADLDGSGSVLREYVYLGTTRLAMYSLTASETLTVNVTTASAAPVAEATINVYDTQGSDTGISASTDAEGKATLNHANLTDGSYQFKVTYADLETWSPVMDISNSTTMNVRLDIELEPVTIQFIDLGSGKPGAVVSVYSTTGEYLNLEAVTDDSGNVTFMLPTGYTYQFKIVYEGETTWTDIKTVGTGSSTLVVGDVSTIIVPLLQLIMEEEEEEVLGMESVQGNITALFEVVRNYDAYYFISDHLSTAQLVLDDAGTTVWQGNYIPFGGVDIVVNTVENNFRFPGQYYDSETGLHYNWNRYYDPATGRYISADPIGLEGGMNLYAYVGGNPVNFSDPKGLYVTGGGFGGAQNPTLFGIPSEYEPRLEKEFEAYLEVSASVGLCIAECVVKNAAGEGAGSGFFHWLTTYLKAKKYARMAAAAGAAGTFSTAFTYYQSITCVVTCSCSR